MITLDEVIAVGVTELDGSTSSVTLQKTSDSAPSAILLLLNSPQYDGTPLPPELVTYGGNDMELLGQWARYYFAPMLYVLKAPPRGPQDLVINYPVGGPYKYPSYAVISLYGPNLGFVPSFHEHVAIQTHEEANRMVNIKRKANSAILSLIRIQTWVSGSIGETDCIFEGEGTDLGRWNSYSNYACLQLPSDGTDKMNYYVNPEIGDNFIPAFEALMVEVTQTGKQQNLRNIAVA